MRVRPGDRRTARRPGQGARLWLALLGALAVALAAAGCSRATRPPSGAISQAPKPTETLSFSPNPAASSPSPLGPAATVTAAPLPPRPKTLIAVTSGGNVETLDPSTGQAVATLASGAVGDQVAVTPDGDRAYFETTSGCSHQILSVPTSGGSPTLVAAGSHPALSPDGSKLAYAVEPLGNGCPATTNIATQYFVVVQPLGGANPTIYPLHPSLVSAKQTRTVNHLSWAPDNRRLLISIDGGSDDKQWNAYVMDTTTDHYYQPASGTGVPVERGGAYYYRQAVFLPDGNLFANIVCCSGTKKPSTTILADVDLNATMLHQISSGLTDRDHTSLDADPGGHWVLYLAGSDLLVSADASTPIILSTAGFVAADW